eukprot:g12825.t1
MMPSISSGHGGAVDQMMTSSVPALMMSEGQHFFGLGIAKPRDTVLEVQRKGNLIPRLAPRPVPSMRGSRVLGIAPTARLGQMEVVPDRMLGSTSYLVAGETGAYSVKARDKHGYERHRGGDEVTSYLIPIAPATSDEVLLQGYVATVHDNSDGTYNLSYLPELAGTYLLQTRVNGERVQHCDEDTIPPSGSPVLNCDRDDPTVTVVPGKLDASRCSLVEFAGQTGLKQTPVGAAAKFSIVSKDPFGNTRTGAVTSFDGYGNGTSDVFIVTLSDNRGHFTRTTSAVQVITVVGTNSTDSSFRLQFGGAISRPLSTSASSAELQATLMSILGDDPVDVVVSETTSPSGDVAWRVTFLSHLEEWGRQPMGAVPDEQGIMMVSVRKVASNGVYPVEYTLQYPGCYRMIVADAGSRVVGEGSRIIEAGSVDTKASWSSVTGDGLRGGAAGDQLSVVVQTMISPPQPKIQALVAWPQDFAWNDTTLDTRGRKFELKCDRRQTNPIPFDVTAGCLEITNNDDARRPFPLVPFAFHKDALIVKGINLVGEGSTSIGDDQPTTGLLLQEISSGCPGVHQVDNRDLETLDFSLFLDGPGGGGAVRDPTIPPAIGRYEKLGLSCFTKTTDEDTQLSGYVELEFMGNRVMVDAYASIFELRERFEGLVAAAGLANTSVVVTFPSDEDTMCGIHGGEVHLEYSRHHVASGIAVSSYYGVSNTSIREITKGVDRVSYLDRGRYLNEYTPIISGTYSPETSIAGGKLTPEATVEGITIVPAYVGTLVEIDKVGSPGAPHTFNVTAVDQDGRFVGPHTQGRIAAAVVAIPDPRADVGHVSASFMAVTTKNIEERGGPHRVIGSFTPEMAGSYIVTAVFLKPDEVWDPVEDISGYDGLASGQKAERVAALSEMLRGDHELTATDPVVVSVFPGRVNPRMTSISGKGFDECTAGTQVAVRPSPQSEPLTEVYQWPKRVNVRSNLASPTETTATGSGVDSAVAGETATFQIQARDAWLNTKYDLRGETWFTVVAFVAGANPDVVPPVYGVVGSPKMSNSGFQYPVAYTPLVGGEQYTLVVLLHQKADTPTLHIGVDRPYHEVQVIRRTFPCTLDDSELSGEEFMLMFKGHRTSTLAFNASFAEVKDALEQLHTIGTVLTDRRDAAKPACGYDYVVYFAPWVHDTLPHILNYGDLPDIVVETPGAAGASHVSTTVYSSGAMSHDGISTRNGHAPYTPVVVPSPPSPEKRAGSSIGSGSSILDNENVANPDGTRRQDDPASGMSAPLPSREEIFAPFEPGPGGVGGASSLGSPVAAWSGFTWTIGDWVHHVMVGMVLLFLIPPVLLGLGMDVPAPTIRARAVASALLSTIIGKSVWSRFVLPHVRHFPASAAAFVRDLWFFCIDSLVSWPGLLGSASDNMLEVLGEFAVAALICMIIYWLAGPTASTPATSASEVEENAACVIQALWRGHLDRQIAAIRLQAWVRRVLVVHRFARKKVAVKLQALQRGWVARTRMAAMRNAAVRVQAVVRGLLLNRKKRTAAVRLQAWGRGVVAKRAVAATRPQRAVAYLQAWARGAIARRGFLRQRKSAISLQVCWRTFAALAATAREEAAVRIQARHRGRVARKQSEAARQSVASACVTAIVKEVPMPHLEQRGQPGSPQRVPPRNVGLATAGSGGAGKNTGRRPRVLAHHESVASLASAAGVARGVDVAQAGQGYSANRARVEVAGTPTRGVGYYGSAQWQQARQGYSANRAHVEAAGVPAGGIGCYGGTEWQQAGQGYWSHRARVEAAGVPAGGVGYYGGAQWQQHHAQVQQQHQPHGHEDQQLQQHRQQLEQPS